jgi:hypothetical protein
MEGNPKPYTYSSFANRLLLPKFNSDKVLDVIYFTKNCVMDSEGLEKLDFGASTDETLTQCLCRTIIGLWNMFEVKSKPSIF